MNTLAKSNQWNPYQLDRSDLFRELETIEQRLESLMGRSLTPWEMESTLSQRVWSPVVDISENEQEYVVKAELPQIPKEDVKVSVRNGVLEISGERKSESEQKGQQFCRVERAYGTFLRSFTLPPGAESQKAQANLREGVLTVKITKNPQAAPKALEVKIS